LCENRGIHEISEAVKKKTSILVKNMSVPHLATWPLLLDTAGYQLDRKGK